MTSTGSRSPATGLRFLIDSADRAAWARLMPLGCFSGVTTNPVLLKAAGVPCDLMSITTLVAEALDLGAGEVHVQVWGGTRDAYVERGRALAAISPKVVVKIPITAEGASAAAALRREGTRVTMTAVYTIAQALAASALGAEYAAPYLGRMNDAGRDGFGDIAGMAHALRGHGSATRLLVASLRGPADVARLAGEGLDTFTLGPKPAAALFDDELTEQAIEAFEAAAKGR
jgi:transaldolase